jgi:hypothetical protein
MHAEGQESEKFLRRINAVENIGILLIIIFIGYAIHASFNNESKPEPPLPYDLAMFNRLAWYFLPLFLLAAISDKLYWWRRYLEVVGNKLPTCGCFLLYLFLSKIDRDVIPGDLEEEFTTLILPKFGPVRAQIWFWVQVVRNIAYRNPLRRWLLIGGGMFKIAEWINQKIGS